MKQILIGLWVPALNETFDVNVPNDMPVKQLSVLLAKAVEEISGSRYVASGNEFLCRLSTKQLLDYRAGLVDYCIKNGEKLALF